MLQDRFDWRVQNQIKGHQGSKTEDIAVGRKVDVRLKSGNKIPQRRQV